MWNTFGTAAMMRVILEPVGRHRAKQGSAQGCAVHRTSRGRHTLHPTRVPLLRNMLRTEANQGDHTSQGVQLGWRVGDLELDNVSQRSRQTDAPLAHLL